MALKMMSMSDKPELIRGLVAMTVEDRDALRAENERLRAALSEMLESFTEPEDDNDILRRARAALGNAKDG